MHDSNLSKLASKEQLEKTFVAQKIYNSNFSTDEFFNQKNPIFLSSFEKLIISNWKGSETSIENSIKIIKEYFDSQEYKLKNNELKFLTLLKNLFKKKIFYFFWFFLKFLYVKFLK